MEKKFAILLILIFYSVLGQQSKSLSVFSLTEKKPLEDVIVLNLKTNNFTYTNAKGQAELIYNSDVDSVRLILPSYEDAVFSVSDINKLKEVVFLKEKPIQLDEIIVQSGEDNYKKNIDFYNLKYKKKYVSSHTSNGGAILSLYKHKKQKNNKLQSISFFFDLKKLGSSEVKIRPLLYQNNKSWIPIIETPTTIILNSDTDEVNIEFNNTNFEFENGKEYLLGFELIDKDKSNTVYTISAIVKNENSSFLRATPNSDWFQLKNYFSLYYKIYFAE